MKRKMYKEYKKLFQTNDQFKDEKYFSFDGIIDLEKYNNAPEKILWILKEPYGKEVFDFDYIEYINDFPFELGKKKLYPKSAQMWQKITYSNQGIFENTAWNNLSDYYEDENVFRALHKSALINLKKVQGETSSSYYDILEYYKIGKDVIMQQIEDINPTVIICGGTFKFIKEDLKKSGLEPKVSNSEKQWDSYLWKNRILIDAYHPSARYDQQKYCDKVINAYLNLMTKS